MPWSGPRGEARVEGGALVARRMNGAAGPGQPGSGGGAVTTSLPLALVAKRARTCAACCALVAGCAGPRAAPGCGQDPTCAKVTRALDGCHEQRAWRPRRGPAPPPGHACPCPSLALCALQVSLVGVTLPVPEAEADVALAALFARHPAMADWPAGHRFAPFELHVKEAHLLDWWVGGWGRSACARGGGGGCTPRASALPRRCRRWQPRPRCCVEAWGTLPYSKALHRPVPAVRRVSLARRYGGMKVISGEEYYSVEAHRLRLDPAVS